jgi:hypothetical protein
MDVGKMQLAWFDQTDLSVLAVAAFQMDSVVLLV